MHPIRRLQFDGGVVTLVLVAATVMRSVDAQEAQTAEPLCSVTDEQVLGATARQQVTLDTKKCTASLKAMVNATFSNVQKTYAAFYKQTHLSPEDIDAFSALLVSRQLLSGSWSAGNVEHYTPTKNPALQLDIDEEMHKHLTPQQIASLKTYQETIPARTLLEPVVNHLERNGRPLSELQQEAALHGTQHVFSDWHKSSPRESTTDPRQQCKNSNAHMNHRDDRIRDVLARSLDEEQLELAQNYYRDLFERRARRFAIYERTLASDDTAICSIPAL